MLEKYFNCEVKCFRLGTFLNSTRFILLYYE